MTDKHTDLSEPIRENKRLKSLLKTATSLNSNLHIEHLLPMIMISARDLLEAEASSLFLLDEKNDYLYCEVAIGEMGKMIKQYLRLELGDGIAGWVAKEKKSLLIEDAYDDERFDRSWDEISGFRTKSIVCIPIYNKDKFIGTLEVINKKNSGVFSLKDTEFLENLGHMAAVALENARLHEGLQVKIKELSLLTSIEKKISQGWSFDRLLPWALVSCVSNLSAKGGSVLLLNDNNSLLQFHASTGFISDQVKQVKSISLDKGIVGISFKEERPVLIKSIHADIRLQGHPIQPHESSSMICAPIRGKDQLYGYIIINDKNDGYVFSRDDLGSLANVADRLAILYKTEYLFKQLQKTNEEQTSAERVMKKILPQTVPSLRNINIFVKYIPFANIGGDFYRFLEVDESTVGVLIVDVSGHGLSAALVSVMVNMVISTVPATILGKPGEFFQYINSNLINRLGGHFMTGFYAVINQAKKTISYSNAGHPSSILYSRSENKCSLLNAPGPLVGVWDSAFFAAPEVVYKPGDRLFMLTDGLLEIDDGKQIIALEESEFSDIIYPNINQPPEELMDNVLASIKVISKDHEFDDDVTMLIIDFNEEA